MLSNRRSADIASGVFLAVLGGVVFAASTTIGEGAGGQLHPRTFPMILGAMLILGGGALAVRTALSRAGEARAVAWPDRKGRRLLFTALAGLCGYVLLSQLLGFLLSSLLFVPWFIRTFGRYGHVLAWSCAVGVVAFLYFVFIRLLQLSLPTGPFPFF
ncbi:MAG: tripartite tricarboxylate transporter TctB family protein [Desulfobacterales bacterium]